MQPNDSLTDKRTATSTHPVKEQQTCAVCGGTDIHVSTNHFQDLDLPPVDAHTQCLPPATRDTREWYREEVDQ